MIISNRCIGANARLSVSPIPITVIEEGTEINAICPFKVEGLCIAGAAGNFDEVKKELNDHPRGEEAEKYPSCLYTKEGIRLA